MGFPQHGYEHVQQVYKLNVGNGTKVRIKPDAEDEPKSLRGRTGTVVGCDKYVYVRLDGEPSKAEPYHPDDVELVDSSPSPPPSSN